MTKPPNYALELIAGETSSPLGPGVAGSRSTRGRQVALSHEQTLNHPALVAFVDERIEKVERLTRIIVGCCLFGRDRWIALHDQESAVGALKPKRRLEGIDRLLSNMGGVGVLVHADIPQELIPARESDGTTDIPRMSRTDNIWSQVVLYAVVAGVAWLQRSGAFLGEVELYYDRKDLTAEHRTQFENVLRQTLPEIARDVAAEYPSIFTADPGGLRFSKIEGVAKPQPGQRPDAAQRGTNLAHHLCAQSAKVIARGTEGRMLARDHTGAVRDMISKFALSHEAASHDQGAA